MVPMEGGAARLLTGPMETALLCAQNHANPRNDWKRKLTNERVMYRGEDKVTGQKSMCCQPQSLMTEEVLQSAEELIGDVLVATGTLLVADSIGEIQVKAVVVAAMGNCSGKLRGLPPRCCREGSPVSLFHCA